MNTATAALLAAVVLTCSLAAQSRTQTPALDPLSPTIEALARTATPAVVHISVRGRAPLEEGAGQRAGFVGDQQATGSGVIVDPDGYIITNAHVVSHARHVEVSMMGLDGAAEPVKLKRFTATIVGLDPETDLAVLKIDATKLPTLSFLNDGASLKQGQLVVALGSPLGLDNSLTVGFVSATGRFLNADKPTFYIQTDAAINPGNSGGPLLDLTGHIVGINTMIYTQSGGNEGIGFAIPSDLVRQIYQDIRKDGHIRRGAIGVLPQDITPTLAAALGLGQDSGVILSDILPRGAAAAAGLEPGDIVVSVDGKPIQQSRQLISAVFQHGYGEEMTLGILRGKEHLEKRVAVLARPTSPSDLEELASHDAHLLRPLGVLALTLDEKVTPVLPGLRRLYGVAIAAVAAEYVALNPGLVAGDVIYEMNGQRMSTLEDLRKALDAKKPGDPIALLIERDEQLQFVSFTLE